MLGCFFCDCENKTNDPADRYCTQCGKDLVSIKISLCNKCDRRLHVPGAIYCSICGDRLPFRSKSSL
jgi:hypothetical protein